MTQDKQLEQRSLLQQYIQESIEAYLNDQSFFWEKYKNPKAMDILGMRQSTLQEGRTINEIGEKVINETMTREEAVRELLNGLYVRRGSTQPPNGFEQYVQLLDPMERCAIRDALNLVDWNAIWEAIAPRVYSFN